MAPSSRNPVVLWVKQSEHTVLLFTSKSNKWIIWDGPQGLNSSTSIVINLYECWSDDEVVWANLHILMLSFSLMQATYWPWKNPKRQWPWVLLQYIHCTDWTASLKCSVQVPCKPLKGKSDLVMRRVEGDGGDKKKICPWKKWRFVLSCNTWAGHLPHMRSIVEGSGSSVRQQSVSLSLYIYLSYTLWCAMLFQAT